MSTLLASVLPLAIGAAISPTILAAQLLMLSSKTDPIKRSAVALLGSGLVLIAYTAIPLVIGATSSGTSHPSTVDGIVKLVFAVILLALGVKAATRSGAEPKKKKPTQGPGLVRSFEFGAVMMAINFTTMALYFPAIHEVAASSVSSSDKFIAILVLFLITMIPAYGPLLATLAFGEHARRVLAKFNDFLTTHQQGVKVAICFLFAAYLGVSSLKILL